MELVVYLLMAFVLLATVVKLSLWPLWPRLAYALCLGLLTWLSQAWAIEQSKTQLADYLANHTALENMAIVVTAESALTFLFCLTGRCRWYPPLLILPAAFYALTQVIFAQSGVSFEQSAAEVSIALALGLPLMAWAVRWALPEEDFRTEVLLLLACFLCVLGLLSTQNGQIIYQAPKNIIPNLLTP